MGSRIRIGVGVALAAFALSARAYGQVEIVLDTDGKGGDGKGVRLWTQHAGASYSGWPRTDLAAKLYNLDADQSKKLNKLVQEQSTGTWQQQSAKWKLASAAAALKEAGISFDEEATKQKVAALTAEIGKHAAETRTRFRDEILNDEQRKTFDAQNAAGNDPISGEPADETLPNHDPAKFKSFHEARMKQWHEQAAAWQGQARAQQVFTGKGFLEAEWTSWLERTAQRTGMDDRQRGIAAEFLDMAKQAAADYRKAKEAEYKKVAADLYSQDAEKRTAAQKAAGELSAPVDEIARRFRKDVTDLLTEEQRKKQGTR